MSFLTKAFISELQIIFFIELLFIFNSVGDLGILLELKPSPCYQVPPARSRELDKKGIINIPNIYIIYMYIYIYINISACSVKLNDFKSYIVFVGYMFKLRS